MNTMHWALTAVYNNFEILKSTFKDTYLNQKQALWVTVSKKTCLGKLLCKSKLYLKAERKEERKVMH